MFSVQGIVVMAVVHRIEDLVQIVLNSRPVPELMMKQPPMRYVFDECVRRQPDGEEEKTNERVRGPKCEKQQDHCIGRIKGRGPVELPSRNASLFPFVCIQL